MSTPEQRAEFARLEYARQMQADEMRRQMQADEMRRQMQAEEMRRQMQAEEMRRADTNREMQNSPLNQSLAAHDEARRAEVALEAAREQYGQCIECRSPGGSGGLCPRCRDARASDIASPRIAPERGSTDNLMLEIVRGEDARRAEVAREQYDQCIECRSPGGGGGLCPRCRDARASDGAPEAALLDYQRSYASSFDKTPQLEDLWNRASDDGASYESARQNFWKIVNTDPSPEAHHIRQMLAAAGYNLDTQDRAPMLADEWDDQKEGRYRNARRLSIDHEVPQSRDRLLSVDSSNLRFMLMDDNLRRGARYGVNETPYNE